MKWKTERLGELKYDSPLNLSNKHDDYIANYVEDDARILVDHKWKLVNDYLEKGKKLNYFEVAGPRSKAYFDGSKIAAAIVTCGGLCPGINDVIRSLVMQLHHHYHVKNILGVRYGFQGLSLSQGASPIELSPELVSSIQTFGGSFLGSSRGPQTLDAIVEFLQHHNVQILFVIGGDGSIRGARDISEECQKRGYKISVIGIPKTIDNDIDYIDKSFGFSTAVEQAAGVLACAHVEAHGAENGIGLVKLMGRHSGFIASRSTIASGFVNFVLVPEIPFQLEGDHGFLEKLKQRLINRGHAVIVVAEGAGQTLLSKGKQEFDKSGNLRLRDIGLHLKKVISAYLEDSYIPFTLKYFDPSYTIRSAPANTEDNVFCKELAQNAVHAAFSGRTKIIIGKRHNEYVMIPMDVAVEKRKSIDPDGSEWLAVMQSTGQPALM